MIMSALVQATNATMTEKAIVHVIDDDESVRGSLELLLRSIGLESRTYASVHEFLHARDEDGPGCIVLDVRLPGISGLDFQSRLGELGIDLPVILMTGYADVPMSVRAMKAGAIDFIPKPIRDQDMIDAVSAAIACDRVKRVADGDLTRVRERFSTLSRREQHVMTLVTEGKMNKQVAGDLGLSEITVKIHRGSAMRKMGARTLADLVRMVELLKSKETKGLH
jgi:FixJ family two-component response regulator